MGSGYEIHLREAAIAQPAALMVGVSNTRGLGVVLPFPLESIGGGRGCFIYSSGEVVYSVLTGSAGEALVPINLPAFPGLVSNSLYHSWLVLDPAAEQNPLGITNTAGGVAVIGG